MKKTVRFERLERVKHTVSMEIPFFYKNGETSVMVYHGTTQKCFLSVRVNCKSKTISEPMPMGDETAADKWTTFVHDRITADQYIEAVRAVYDHAIADIVRVAKPAPKTEGVSHDY